MIHDSLLPTPTARRKDPPSGVVVPRLTELPTELQVNLLTYLRAFDLAAVQQTCSYYARPGLVHAIVAHTAESVYPCELTAGFESQATTKATGGAVKRKGGGHAREEPLPLYTFEHLRNMELLVIARVLSRPEPPTGYIVSKSWCKTALKWLEVQQEDQQQKRLQASSSPASHKKVSKRKSRLRQRRLSDASPPWPNVNSDLLCEHEHLQACSNSKQVRARRKVLDKQAWRILKKLYPDSTPLQSVAGECLQCRLQDETATKTRADQEAAQTLARQAPLQNAVVRRVYTRTRGLPEQAVVGGGASVNLGICPLQPGTYVVVSRAWLSGYRKYLKTGLMQGQPVSRYPSPDATELQCDAHRRVLVPPHLQQYLEGRSATLWSPNVTNVARMPTTTTTTTTTTWLVPGASLPVCEETLVALQAAGLSASDVNRQVAAMRSLELKHSSSHQVAAAASPASTQGLTKNQILDRDNLVVVELLTADEYEQLCREETNWQCATTPPCRVTIRDNASWTMTASVCHACPASGRAAGLYPTTTSSRSSKDLPRVTLEY